MFFGEPIIGGVPGGGGVAPGRAGGGGGTPPKGGGGGGTPPIEGGGGGRGTPGTVGGGGSPKGGGGGTLQLSDDDLRQSLSSSDEIPEKSKPSIYRSS